MHSKLRDPAASAVVSTHTGVCDGDLRQAGFGAVSFVEQSEAKVLNKVKPVGCLNCLRSALANGLGIEATTVAAHHFNRRVLLEPIGSTLDAPILQDIDNRAPLKIDNNRAVAPCLSPAPVVDIR